MSIEGFEPSPFYRIAPEATALDRSAKLTKLKFSSIKILSKYESFIDKYIYHLYLIV